MTHICETLARSGAEKLDALARRFVEGMAESMAENDEAVFEYEPLKRVESIEHESRSGFWSWNSGGYEVCLPASLAHAWSSGYCPDPILPTIKSGNAIIADCWHDQHPDRPPLAECLCAYEGEPGYEWQEAAQEWEQEGWLSDDDCYYWKARAVFYDTGSPQNTTGEPEVYLDAYLCSDSYGRDYINWAGGNQTAGEFKLTLPLTKFLALTPAHIDRMVATATRKLPPFVNCV